MSHTILKSVFSFISISMIGLTGTVGCQSKTNEKPLPDVTVRTPEVEVKLQNELNDNLRSVRLQIQTFANGMNKTKEIINLTIDSNSSPISIVQDIFTQLGEKNFKKGDGGTFYIEGTTAVASQISGCTGPIQYKVVTSKLGNILNDVQLLLKSCQTSAAYLMVAKISKNALGTTSIEVSNSNLAKVFPIEKFITDDLKCVESSQSALKFECDQLTIGKNDGVLWKASIKVDQSLNAATVIQIEGLSLADGTLKHSGKFTIDRAGKVKAENIHLSNAGTTVDVGQN